MDLYFAPLACSMSSRIALYETGVVGRFVQVDTRRASLADGAPFLPINPLGQVPVLRTETGTLLTENSAILQHIARRHPEAGLLGRDDELPWLQQWLSFIGTELHKSVFTVLLDPKTPEEARRGARELAAKRFDVLEAHLSGRDYVLDGFTVADAYLATVLNWCAYSGVDLERWPSVKAYLGRLKDRPSVARALREETSLYRAEQAKAA